MGTTKAAVPIARIAFPRIIKPIIFNFFSKFVSSFLPARLLLRGFFTNGFYYTIPTVWEQVTVIKYKGLAGKNSKINNNFCKSVKNRAEFLQSSEIAKQTEERTAVL